MSFKTLCLSLVHLRLMVFAFLFAGIILLFVQIIFSQKTSKQELKHSSLAGLMVGFFLFVGYLLQTFGLLYTTSSKAGFLTGLSIVMVPILSFIF
ncbi:EamA family transporter [Bacillus cereus]